MDTTIKDGPLVSVIMITYNHAGFLPEAIESVISQTYNNWELLILDDASTDDTERVTSSFVARDSRIKYLPASQNLGITKNRNRGLAMAQGECVAILDSDDFWCDTAKLEKQVSYLRSHPEKILVGTQVKVINGDKGHTDNFLYKTLDADIRKKILLRNQFTHSSIVFRMKPNLRYDESIQIWEDYELILRLGIQGKLANLPEIMTTYRKHTGNISKEKKLYGAQVHLAIIKKYKDSYPNFLLGLLKGYLRWLLALTR